MGVFGFVSLPSSFQLASTPIEPMHERGSERRRLLPSAADSVVEALAFVRPQPGMGFCSLEKHQSPEKRRIELQDEWKDRFQQRQ